MWIDTEEYGIIEGSDIVDILNKVAEYSMVFGKVTILSTGPEVENTTLDQAIELARRQYGPEGM